MASLRVECLRCGEVRALQTERSSRLDAGECPRCTYVGWATCEDVTEVTRDGSTRAPARAPPAPHRLSRLGFVASTEQRELWGAETRKAVENFPVSGEPIPAAVARWLGRIKAAAARVNAELGLLDADKAERIAAAADRVAAGELDDQFPIDVFQTGSGTSSNMNANEVIAALAGDDVHANDDVNMGQSSNDVFPSAVHLAALGEITRDLLPALEQLAESLEAKAARVRRRGQVGPHALDGRRPRHARPGVRRLRGAGPARRRARPRRAAAARPDPARRDRDRHRPEHASGVRGARARPARRRTPGSRSPRPPTRSSRRPRATGSSRPPVR